MKGLNMKLAKNKKNCHQSVEIPSHNLIDGAIQSLLRPLNILQMLCFCPKYCIKDNFIYTNSRLSNITSVCMTVFFITAFLFRVFIYYYDEFLREHMGFLYIMACYDFCLYFAGFCVNCILSTVQGKCNVNFVLTIQSVFKFINNRKRLQTLTFSNWMWISFYLISYTSLSTILYIFSKHQPTFIFFYAIILLCFDANIIYTIRCLIILKEMVHLWNEEISSHRLTRNMYRKNYYEMMFQSYTNILMSYDILKTTFKYVVLFYFIEYFTHTLFYMQSLIVHSKLSTKTNKAYVFEVAVSIVLWLLKTFTIKTTLCVYCEKFYIALRNTESSCVLINKSNSTGRKQILSKNVQRLYRSSFKKMSVCGLFCIDAVLPLSLVGLLTSYIVVLLQFAFV